MSSEREVHPKVTSKKPLEDRTKSLYVNKNFLRQREEMEQRITSEEGCILRVNRSIQAEGLCYDQGGHAVPPFPYQGEI